MSLKNVIEQASYYGNFNATFGFANYNFLTDDIVKNQDENLSIANKQMSVNGTQYLLEEIHENVIFEKNMWNFCLKIKFENSDKWNNLTIYFNHLNED